ncbi:hypothetical protein E2562_023893 [Oryza meyeriana var. granulata]|uniref:Uncharacterized protein n=1 Tax=Oryza meyeriana var. granulata TaxID=110450 RepID=A0A6G1D778_9ORYZ|nr:hypothetical protein E2562_023893 [Oryza meyeriana var. granulata]
MAKARVINLAILSLYLLALLVLTAVPEAAGGRAAPYISYPALNHDRIPGTPQLNHHGGSANKYTRGCEPQFHCRGKKRG